jgi:hypothetical protein
MKTIRLLLVALVLTLSSNVYSQVYVNNVDLNKAVKMFELHCTLRPFTPVPCLYIDYGQKFIETFYDSKTQAVCDSNNVKFKKGELMKLMQYLDNQGWIVVSQRDYNLTTITGSIITYKRKE